MAKKGSCDMRHNAGILWGSKNMLAAVLIVATASGCNFGPRKKSEDRKPAAAARNTSDPGIDLNCIIDHIQNPPEAFHYSYKHNNLDEEGDLTPQTMDGTRVDDSGTHTFHGVRSDRESWQNGWVNLSAVGGAASTFALIHSTSATVRESNEKVNGYDAIRYSVDTARATAVENVLYRSTLGAGGFEKGTVWITSQGCPVKFSLDSEMHLNDGSVQKDHYEEAMIKK
jgi:hypothetical protein